MLPPTIDLDHQPLVDQLYKVSETISELDLYEIHNWLKHKFLNMSDELNL